MSPFKTDVEFAELQLKAKIKRGINNRYLQVLNNSLEIGEDGELAGRIECNEDSEESEESMVLIIDGMKISKDDFWRLLNCYEGWQFKFKIIDRTDE